LNARQPEGETLGSRRAVPRVDLFEVLRESFREVRRTIDP